MSRTTGKIRFIALVMVFVLMALLAIPCYAKNKTQSTADLVVNDTSHGSTLSGDKQDGKTKTVGKTTSSTAHANIVPDPFTKSKSSLWSNKDNLNAIPKKGGLKGDTLKDFTENPRKYIERYRIMSGVMVTDVDAVVPYNVASLFFGISRSLCEYTIVLTDKASNGAFQILEGGKKKDYNKKLWKGFTHYFSTSNKSFNIILGFIVIFIGLFGLLMLIQGRISEGFGRIGACILIFVLAVFVYGNATSVMKTSINISRGISTALEDAFNMVGTPGANGTSSDDNKTPNLTYALIMDNMVVKPYNHLQYGSYDPIKKGEVMSKMKTMYNYFITYTADDRDLCWFGDSAGNKQNKEIYGDTTATNAISQSAHKAVAAKLSNEEQILRKLGEFFNGDAGVYDKVYNGFVTAYGSEGTKVSTIGSDTDEVPVIKVGGKQYSVVKIYGTEGWYGKLGEAFLNLILSIILAAVYLAIAFITFAGQIMVLFAMMFGLPVCIYGMFKGFEPVKKLIIVFVGGFACCVVSGIMRGMFSSFLSVFQIIAGDNLVYQLGLILVLLFVGVKLIKKFFAAASDGTTNGARMALMRARMDAMRANSLRKAGGRGLKKGYEKGKGGIRLAKNAGAVAAWGIKGIQEKLNGDSNEIQKPPHPNVGDDDEKTKPNKEETNDEDLKNKDNPENKDKEKLKDQENDDGIEKRSSANTEHHKEDIKDRPDDIAKEKAPNNANTDGKEEKEKPQKVSEIDKVDKENNANLGGAEKTDDQKAVDKIINENERAANKDNTIDDKSVIEKKGDATAKKEDTPSLKQQTK